NSDCILVAVHGQKLDPIGTAYRPTDLNVTLAVLEFSGFFILLTFEKSLSQWHFLPPSVGAWVVTNFPATRIRDPETCVRHLCCAAGIIYRHPSHREALVVIFGVSFLVDLPCRKPPMTNTRLSR